MSEKELVGIFNGAVSTFHFSDEPSMVWDASEIESIEMKPIEFYQPERVRSFAPVKHAVRLKLKTGQVFWSSGCRKWWEEVAEQKRSDAAYVLAEAQRNFDRVTREFVCP